MAATSRPPYRYASIESCTSSTTSSSHFSAPSPSSVNKFIEKRSKSKAGSRDGKALVVPPDLIAKDIKKTAALTGKGSNLSTLHNKLFQKGGTQDCCAVKALTEVNTRTLSMVLRSERELLSQNKDYENQISELHLLLEMKNREAEKLKDLCIKQREEICLVKNLAREAEKVKDLCLKQREEICLVKNIAEVKADKYALCFDEQVSTPRTPICGQDAAAYSLEFSSADTATPGSSDDMFMKFMKDVNPCCLTP